MSIGTAVRRSRCGWCEGSLRLSMRPPTRQFRQKRTRPSPQRLTRPSQLQRTRCFQQALIHHHRQLRIHPSQRRPKVPNRRQPTRRFQQALTHHLRQPRIQPSRLRPKHPSQLRRTRSNRRQPKHMWRSSNKCWRRQLFLVALPPTRRHRRQLTRPNRQRRTRQSQRVRRSQSGQRTRRWWITARAPSAQAAPISCQIKAGATVLRRSGSGTMLPTESSTCPLRRPLIPRTDTSCGRSHCRPP